MKLSEVESLGMEILEIHQMRHDDDNHSAGLIALVSTAEHSAAAVIRDQNDGDWFALACGNLPDMFAKMEQFID